MRAAVLPDADPAVPEAAQALLDVAVRTHGNSDGETFAECRACGEWEGHKAGCFVPALQQWLSGPGADELLLAAEYWGRRARQHLADMRGAADALVAGKHAALARHAAIVAGTAARQLAAKKEAARG